MAVWLNYRKIILYNRQRFLSCALILRIREIRDFMAYRNRYAVIGSIFLEGVDFTCLSDCGIRDLKLIQIVTD